MRLEFDAAAFCGQCEHRKLCQDDIGEDEESAFECMLAEVFRPYDGPFDRGKLWKWVRKVR